MMGEDQGGAPETAREAAKDFVSKTTISLLRQMRGYLYERQQREQQAAQGRKRLAEVSRNV